MQELLENVVKSKVTNEDQTYTIIKEPMETVVGTTCQSGKITIYTNQTNLDHLEDENSELDVEKSIVAVAKIKSLLKATRNIVNKCFGCK